MLAFEPRPDLGVENPDDLVEVGQRVEQDLHKPKSALALFVDKLQRCDVRLIGADLAVANDPIAGELEPCELIA